MSLPAALLKARWKERRLPLVDTLLFASGRVVLYRSSTLVVGGEISSRLDRIADTTLLAALQRETDEWFQVEPLCSVDQPITGRRYLAGEGEMGNEGFIAAEATTTSELVWAICFRHSNPFDTLRIEARRLVATNNRDEDWIVDLADPGCITIKWPPPRS